MCGGDLMLEISDKEALEKFLMDIDILDTIYARLSHFNPFETLSIVNAEIRHSNVLAWLLNPNENHGLDDIFLKKIIQDVYYKNKEYIESKRLSLFDISLMDYHNFIIKREWNNIDIICVSDEKKFVFVIENKVWSKESENQLMKYFHTVNREYPDYDKIFIFLTANNDTPSDADNWIPMDYGFIFETLQKVIGIKGDAVSPNVKIFIEQYLYMLRRYIVGECSDPYCKRLKHSYGFGESILGSHFEKQGYKWIHHDYNLFGGNKPGKYPIAEEVITKCIGIEKFDSARTLYKAHRNIEEPDLLIYKPDCSEIRFAESKRLDTRDQVREEQIRGLALFALLFGAKVEVYVIAEEGV